MPKITFTREKKTVECEEGEKLRDVAIANEIQLYPGMKRFFNCHGFGQCGECRVHVTKGMENVELTAESVAAAIDAIDDPASFTIRGGPAAG